MIIDVDNHLIEVEAKARVSDVAARALSRGFLLGGPVGPFTFIELAQSSSIFADALLSRAIGRASSSEPAPRAAAGPDLLGAFHLGALVPERVFVKCFDLTRVRVVALDEAQAARELELGTAFAIARARGRLLAIASDPRGAPVVDNEEWLAHVSTDMPGGRALNPLGALAQPRAIVAPFQGRAGTFGEPARSPRSVDDLVAAMRGVR